MIANFTLAKTGSAGNIVILEPQHLQHVLTLQDETRAALPEGQKMFVLPQAPDYFKNLLSGKTGFMLGAMAGDRLVAQIALMGPLTLEQIKAKNLLTRNECVFHHADDADAVILAKSMAVHPGYRGNELSQHVLQAALEMIAVRAANHVFAQISVDNARSWELFLRNGFGIISGGVDPGDQKPRFVLQRPASGFKFAATAQTDDVDAVADFAAIMQLTQRDALVGCLDENGTGLQLAFSPVTVLADEVGSTPGGQALRI